MATRITFAVVGGSDPLAIEVSEEPNQVEQAVNRAGGLPFRLTDANEGHTVYVNPLVIAFWTDHSSQRPMPA